MKKIIMLLSLFMFCSVLALQAHMVQVSGNSILLTATLHPQPSAPVGTPVTVSFGMPFPKEFISDLSLIRVRDSSGNEIPIHVRTILRWKSITSGSSLPYIRSALIQMNMTFINNTDPVNITVETGTKRKRDVSAGTPVKQNWVQVNDHKYHSQYNVFEPVVYVTLPPAWLGRCAIKSRTVPFGTYSSFSWYDSALSNSDQQLNSGMDFFKTATNNDPRVSSSNRLNYLTNGVAWLFDRATALFTVYLRSGKVEHLREAHRAAYFYADCINNSGFFSMRNGDHKYVYGEGMLTDLILMGDESHIDRIKRTAAAAATFNYEFRPAGGFWTERHFGFTWLAQIVAFEATGCSKYATRAQEQADYMFHLQDNPPSDSIHGQAPKLGALMHSYSSHEGSWDSSRPYWIFSPWMTVFVVDAMQRYYQHSNDPRILRSGRCFGDAVIDYALTCYDSGDSPGCLKVPAYLAGENPAIANQWDNQHALDVMSILAFAYKCSVLEGSPDKRYRQEALELLETSRKTFDKFIHPNSCSSGFAIYRLPHDRTFNWWFRTTSNLDYLLHYDSAGESGSGENLSPGNPL